MLQLSAPNVPAARVKISKLPHGSWGAVKVPSEQRVLVFSVCGDNRLTFSYSADSFAKVYTPAMAQTLKKHAAKSPTNEEVKKLELRQRINNDYISAADKPTSPTDSNVMPSAPSSEDDF